MGINLGGWARHSVLRPPDDCPRQGATSSTPPPCQLSTPATPPESTVHPTLPYAQLTEALRGAPVKYNIGCHARAPRTSTLTSRQRHSPALCICSRIGYQLDPAVLASLRATHSAGMDPVELAGHMMTAIRANRLYVASRSQANFDAGLAALPPEDSAAEGVARRRAATWRVSSRSARGASRARIGRPTAGQWTRPRSIAVQKQLLSCIATCEKALF
jgi:hypothetical protein